MLYVNDMPQDCSFGFVFISMRFRLNISTYRCLYNLCEFFIINKINIYFGEDKAEYILLGCKQDLKKAGNLNTGCHEIEIKQHSKVTYLSCLLDKTMSGESMVLKAI